VNQHLIGYWNIHMMLYRHQLTIKCSVAIHMELHNQFSSVRNGKPP
jgi:hypothetical protein